MELDDLDDDALNQLMDSVCEDGETAESEPDLLLGEKLEKPKPEHLNILSKYFGHKSFRPLQWEIIATVMQKRDVCAIMNTGYGKSLCFQFPSTFLGGVTLVVSPLIALMEDQVLSLQVAGIPACLLGTAQKNPTEVIDDIFKNKYSLVYLTPEFCTGDYGSAFLTRLSEELSVTLIAIDEAHCISSWGHDFRPQYRQLCIFRKIFKNVPIIAVTATATTKVREDIMKNLKLRNPLLVCSGFDRPNIYFEVKVKGHEGIFKDITQVMTYEKGWWKFSGPTIIYCITRKDTEEISRILRTNGLKSLPYHAGLPMSAREEAHESFVKDKIDVIVATIAFGMGIDKPDIRNIIHYGCSKSIENYYQEVGRAGRDGLPCYCVTFFSDNDFQLWRFIISKSQKMESDSSLQKMERYLTSYDCRRKFILEHFEDKVDHLNKPRNSCCDVCTVRLQDSRTDHEKYDDIDENGCFDFTEYARMFLGSVSVINSDIYGVANYIKFVRGSSTAKCSYDARDHSFFGSGKHKPEAWWRAVAKMLVEEGYLSERTMQTATGFHYTGVSLTEKGRQCFRSYEKIVKPAPPAILKLLKPKPIKGKTWINTSTKLPCSGNAFPIANKEPSSSETLEELEERMELYQKLLKQRGEIAVYLDCMPYVIASNAALMEMSKRKPRTLNEMRLLNLDGFAEAKINKFGNKFLKIINGNLDDRPTPSKKKPSILEVLNKNPMPDVCINLTAQVSWSMLQSGLKVEEIAQKRSISVGTIIKHLEATMKFGQPIKLKDLGVDRNVLIAVFKAHKDLYNTDFKNIKLSLIKERCPPQITYEQIRITITYLEIRYHLQKLNIPYEDFEDFDFNQVIAESRVSDKYQIETENSPNIGIQTEDEDIIIICGDFEDCSEQETQILCYGEETNENPVLPEVPVLPTTIENYSNVDTQAEAADTIGFEDISEQETQIIHYFVEEQNDLVLSGVPNKKFKADSDQLEEDILNSPPRLVQKTENAQISDVPVLSALSESTNIGGSATVHKKTPKKSKKTVLPPWLTVKKLPN